VETTRVQENWAATGLPLDLAYSACTSAGKPTDATCLDGWTVSAPTNTPGGNIKGSEISYQQPFFFLPAPFNNFGTILNYTYVESNIKYVNTNAPTRDAAGNLLPISYTTNTLLQLSKNAANATLYWDNGTWSARVSAAYRSPYLTNVPGQNLNDVELTKQTINVDFASSWNVTDNLQVTVEALNLTNQFQYQTVDTNGNRLSYYHQQGRDYLLGARYKF
jgi:iron complex outermembrane recepter protein